jgi:hypothetical protein
MLEDLPEPLNELLGLGDRSFPSSAPAFGSP